MHKTLPVMMGAAVLAQIILLIIKFQRKGSFEKMTLSNFDT